MGSTQERIKKRREYQKQKGIAYAKIAVGVALVVTLFLNPKAYRQITHDIPLMFHQLPGIVPKIAFLLLCMLSAIVMAGYVIYGWRMAHQGKQEASQLVYVPPVTARTLLVEEVLLRGAEEPIQEQSNVLLRAAQNSGETTGKELLRESQEPGKTQDRSVLRGTGGSADAGEQQLLRGAAGGRRSSYEQYTGTDQEEARGSEVGGSPDNFRQ